MFVLFFNKMYKIKGCCFINIDLHTCIHPFSLVIKKHFFSLKYLIIVAGEHYHKIEIFIIYRNDRILYRHGRIGLSGVSQWALAEERIKIV